MTPAQSLASADARQLLIPGSMDRARSVLLLARVAEVAELRMML
jgi:hypothetical protein